MYIFYISVVQNSLNRFSWGEDSYNQAITGPNCESRACMPVFYKIDKERRLVLSSASGVFSRVEAAAHMERLQKDPDFDPSYSQIADFSQVTKIDLQAQDVRELAQRSIFSTQSRRALIAPGDTAYGLARMFGMLRENQGEMGIGIFRTLEEALDWVFSRQTSA